MLSTIVVTPRERFSLFRASLESLFSTISNDTPVIVFDSGAPAEVRAQLRELKQSRDFDLHETDTLLPPEVRNRAYPLVKTKYTVYCDNDVFYSPNWLTALEENAERHGSGAVAPLTLIGPSPNPKIHHAGSELSVHSDRRHRPRLKSVHRLDGTPYQEALRNGLLDIPVECQEFEYHCAMLRTDVIHDIGGHDERQVKHDHLNDSLRIQMKGHRITFEKNAVITYHAFAPFADYDWPFFFLRWSMASSRDSERTIGECWGARKNYEESELGFAKMHRQRVAASYLPAWQRKIRAHTLRDRLEKRQLRKLEQRFPALRHDFVPHVPEAPPKNGLQLAGLAGAELVLQQPAA